VPPTGPARCGRGHPCGITEAEGMADDEPCDALGSRIAVAKTPVTAKTAPTASQEARRLNLRRDPESTGTTPLCPPIGEARTRSCSFLSPLYPATWHFRLLLRGT
jgi:hypothetical protein